MLAHIVRDARRARAKRKRLNSPRKLRREGAASMFARMRGHLRDVARRALNDLAKLGHPMPTPEALAAALAAYVWGECERLVYVQAPGEPRLSARGRAAYLDGAEAVDRVSENVARYALRDPGEPVAYMAEMQRRGGNGGRAGKRRPEWERDPGKLDALAALDGMTAATQAARLGVSERTISNMRHALRERPET
jgi:hypothetical protein